MDYHISTPMQLAHMLRDVRKSQKLSQDAAGKLMGLIAKTISSLENHPEAASVDSLLKLLSALNLELIVARKNQDDKKLSRTSKTNEDW